MFCERKNSQHTSINNSKIIFNDGTRVKCKAFILCAGTFLRGLMHTGTQKHNRRKIYEKFG